MMEALMEYETIDADQIDDIMNGQKARPPADWGDNDGGGSGTKVETAEAPPVRDDAAGPIGGPAGEH